MAPATRGRGRPKQDPIEVKNRLLESAAKLFNRDGYFGTDSNKIALDAGLGPASFYRHFPDKKAAFLAAYGLWVESDWRMLEQAALEQKDQMAGPRADTILTRYLERHREWSVFRRSMHALTASDNEARSAHLSVRAEQLKRLETLLNKLGGARLDEAELLQRFLSFERCANALADGEVAALGVSETAFTALLKNAIEAMLAPSGRRE